jgi:hypothetical protein
MRKGSVGAAGARMGACAAAVLLLTAVLAPSHGARLQNLLVGLYNPTSASYRHFLAQHDETARSPAGHAVPRGP